MEMLVIRLRTNGRPDTGEVPRPARVIKAMPGGAKDDSGQEQSIAPDVSVNRHDCKPPNCHCLYFNCNLTIFQV